MIKPEGKKFEHLILVELYGEPTKQKEPEKNWVSKDVTDQTVCIFNAKNSTYTDNCVYESSKEHYFKKNGRRWYLKDFV